MLTIVIIFALAAAGGATMAVIRLRGKPLPPLGLALLHGAAAATALVLLALQVFGTPPAAGMARYALIVFVAAALGGFVLFSFHLRAKELPVGLVLGHGLIAVVGFGLLLAAIM